VAAKAGYDVWMGNTRGNQFSQGHTTLDPVKDAKEYWNFDWQEMGTKDLPASFDYVLKETNAEKLAYIGHSEGTTEMFYGLSEDMDYFGDKVSVYIALAPVADLPNTEIPILKTLANNYNTIYHAWEAFGIYQID